MVLGNFEDDLNLYLSSNSSKILASKKSFLDLKTIGEDGDGLLGYGKMYCFKYFTQSEKFYDQFPIVLGLGPTDTNNQLGINLHYIPYNIRLTFIRNILENNKRFFNSQIDYYGNVKRQDELSTFNYEFLKGYLKGYNLNYAVKQYRLDRMVEPRDIGYENWYIGVVNDENFFFGGNISQAQDLFFK